jgi:hypothetical protein
MILAVKGFDGDLDLEFLFIRYPLTNFMASLSDFFTLGEKEPSMLSF